MTLGLSLSAFTTLHVIISLVAIAAGFVVLAQMLSGRKSEGWTAFFLATTVLTSVTGFMLPASTFTPAHAVGVMSLVLLALAVVGWYRRRLVGSWRWIYVVTAIASLYLNAFVAIVQAFQKIAFLDVQNEVPFLATHLGMLIAFIWLGIRATRRFRPASLMPLKFIES